MKVLYFSRSYTPHDHRFLRRLANTDYTVYFMQIEETISSRENRPIPRGIVKIHWDGGKRSLELKNIRRNKTSLERVLKDLKPDLVHAGPVQMSAFLTALTGFRPLISMSWGSDLLWDARKGLGRWIARYTLSRSTIFLCDCNTVSQAGQALGMPRERIIQFPWGVDLDHFSPGSGDEVRETLGWENATILLSTRSWEPMYGVDILCQAFLHIAQKEDEICLLLLGDGSLRDQIKAMFHSSGLEDRIHLAGFVDFDDLPKYYRAADLYISASHVDGSSVSLLEAMACGIPPLVSDIPGNQEWVTPGENGWWFPDGSSEGLAKVILSAIQDRNRLTQYGEKSRQIALERADWKRNSERLLYSYEKAMAIGREQPS